MYLEMFNIGVYHFIFSLRKKLKNVKIFKETIHFGQQFYS